MKKHRGIIVKSFIPQKQKLCVLDETLGKIMCVPNRDHLSNGLQISYYAQEKNNIHFLHNIEIIDAAFSLAQEDILFYHHVLELCYYFVPLGSYAPALFDLLLYLYASPKNFFSTVTKKIILFKIFVALGIHPEDSRFQMPWLHRLASESIDNITDEIVNLSFEKVLDDWLFCCITEHPYNEQFKTVRFLTMNRVK